MDATRNLSRPSGATTRPAAAGDAATIATSPWSRFEQRARGRGPASTGSPASAATTGNGNSSSSEPPSCDCCGYRGFDVDLAWSIERKHHRRCRDRYACLLRLLSETEAERAIRAAA